MPSSRGCHPTRASMMCGLATPGIQLPPPQAGYSPGTACEAPRGGEFSSPIPSCHHWLVGEPRPRGPRGAYGHSSLETPGTSSGENPRCLLDYPTKGWGRPSHHPGPDSQSRLSYPQRQDWKEWGLCLQQPLPNPTFSVPLCPSILPSIHPSPCVTSPPWLRPGGGGT